MPAWCDRSQSGVSRSFDIELGRPFLERPLQAWHSLLQLSVDCNVSVRPHSTLYALAHTLFAPDALRTICPEMMLRPMAMLKNRSIPPKRGSPTSAIPSTTRMT